jgi:raffinose/stachyose/melibiose transport system substrate-binding protein
MLKINRSILKHAGSKVLKLSLLLLSVVIFICFFCDTNILFGGEKPKEAKKPVTFTIFFHFTPQEARGVVFRQLIEQYNQENSGKVKVELSYFADWIPMQQKIRTMVSAGEPPDVFYFNFNPNDLSLPKSGELMDFSRYMDAKWKERFYPSDLEMLTFNGQLIAIPVEQGSVLFYYNKKLFKKAGIDSFPQTWDEFFNICERLKRAGITPVSLFTADDAWHATNFFTSFAAGIGGVDVFSTDKSLDSPAIIEAAKRLQRLFSYTTPDAIGGKWAVSVQNFLTERTAMLFDGPWVIGMIEGQMSEPDQVEVVPAPTFKKGEPYLLVTDALTPWAASKRLNDQQKEAVVNFLKWFTSEEIAKKMAIEGKFSYAVKMSLTEEEKRLAGPKLAANIEFTTKAEKKVWQITRVLKPSAMNELPRLVEGLALSSITPDGFAKRLEEANK